jgi:hypothetical protein
MLGVLYRKFTPGKEEFWVVIHPMYSESQLREVMIKSLKGTQCQYQKEKHYIKIDTAFPYSSS